MDLKRFFTTLLITGVLMLGFMYLFRGNGAAGGAAPASSLAPYAGYSAVPTYKAPEQYTNREAGAVPEQRVLGDITPGSKSGDKLSLTINDVTGGVDAVYLKDYPQDVGGTAPLKMFESVAGKPKPFATLGIHIRYAGSAQEINFGAPAGTQDAETIARANATCLLNLQYVWKFNAAPAAAADGSSQLSMFMTLNDTTSGAPVARITKTFAIRPGSYDVTVTHTIENLSGKELQVSVDQAGGIELPRDDPSYDDRFFMATSLDSTKKYVSEKAINITHLQLPKMLAGGKNDWTGGTDPVGTKTLPQMADYAKDPAVWVAASNRFFTSIIRPAQESSASEQLVLSGQSSTPTIRPAHHVAGASLDLLSVDERHPENDVALIRLTGAMLPVPAGTAAAPGTLSEPLAVYLGPKKEQILDGSQSAPVNSPDYDRAAYLYINIVQFNTCWLYSFCVSGWLVFSILHILDFFAKYLTFHNYGLAIMLLVIVVRLLLHPLTRMSQINMAKMGKQMRDLKPKIDAMKKKYEDDKQKQSQEMMKLYREHNINPAGGVLGCLPMFLQMPIWAALITGLRLDIDLRHASFIPGWINDLSNPDTIFPHGTALGHPLFTLPLVGYPIYGLNLLPLLLAVVMYFNMQVTMATQPAPADEQQAQMQKFSKYSIFMLPIFMYNMPSGSNLYIFASTIGGLVDTYFIRKTLKRKGILPQSAKALPTGDSAK